MIRVVGKKEPGFFSLELSDDEREPGCAVVRFGRRDMSTVTHEYIIETAGQMVTEGLAILLSQPKKAA